MKYLRIDRSRATLLLLALVISTSSIFAAGIAVKSGGVDVTAIAVSCNLQTSSSAALASTTHPVTVTLSASPSSAITIGTSLPGTTPVAVTAAAGTTLAATTTGGAIIYSTGIVFNINAQPYCANITSTGVTTATFNFTGTGGLTSPTITVTFTTTGGTATSTVTPTSFTLACNTSSPTSASQTVTVVPAAAPPPGMSIVYSATTYMNAGSAVTASNSPLVVTVPNTAQSSTGYAGVSVTVGAQPYCANISGAGSTTQTFTLAGTVTGAPLITVTPVVVTVTFVVTAGPSPLTVSPSAITINCTHSGAGTTSSDYTLGQPQTVSVTGPSSASLAFSVNTNTAVSTALNFATLSVTPSNVTAGAVPYNFSIGPNSTCNGYTTNGPRTGTIHLTNGANLDKIINVTINMVSGSPLQSSITPSTLNYVKGSGTPGYVDVLISNLSGNVPTYFTVDTSSLPPWLTVDAVSGLTPRSLRFNSTSIADTMAPGSYNKTIRVQTANYGDLLVTISMRVSNPPSTLSVSGTPTAGCNVTGPTQSCNWTIGQPLPTLYVTLKSSDAPVAYSITSGGTLAPVVPSALMAGLAYSFGTTIPITFSQSVFVGVAPGTMVSGTVGITSGNPANTYVVTFNITAQAPGAILTGVSPSIVPTLSAGQQVQVVLTGSGFVKSADPFLATTVGIVNGQLFAPNTNFNVNVLNASNILLTITVPTTADPLLQFNTANTFPVIIGVCNPQGSVPCTIPTGSTTLTIGAKPIIQTITSASSYAQSSSNPPVAPYDMISIFGTNLCASCVGSNAIMYGSAQAPNLGYPTSLSNTDASTSVTRTLQVGFKTHVATTDPLTTDGLTITGSPVYAPLLFATNTQINLLVPQAVAAALVSGNHLVDVVVSFGAANSVVSSNPYPVTVVPSNPGLFTIDASGQGNGAILDKNYAVAGSANPIAMHSSAASDSIMIYLTGLGEPASSASNLVASGNANPLYSDDCIAATGATGYTTSLGTMTGFTPTSVDGLILQRSLLNTARFVPCLDRATQKPSVTIGGLPVASVDYAGWVADSIVGLYQINASLRGTTGTFKTTTSDCQTFTGDVVNITRPTQLPVCIKTTDNNYSQAGVMLWVAPRLVVAQPTAATGTPATLVEQVTVAASGTGHTVIATEGSGSGYTYAITSGVLPAGMSMDNTGVISGTPSSGTIGSYPITVTATDTSAPPITGTVSFTVQVGLKVTSTIVTTGTVSVTNCGGAITAAGGNGSYTYSIVSGALPAGMSLGANFATDGTVTGTPSAGNTGTVVFKATDSNGVSGFVSITFNIT